MGSMYEVYSMSRTGRPRWALAATAILLLLTVGMAALVVHRKSAAGQVPLGSQSCIRRSA